MSVASLLRTGCTTNLSRRRGLLECRCLLAAIVHVPARGKKMKFGGITRDPYRSLKNKIAQAKAMETNKTPLMSRERKDRSLLYPFTVTSIGTTPITCVMMTSLCTLPRRVYRKVCPVGKVCQSSNLHSSGKHGKLATCRAIRRCSQYFYIQGRSQRWTAFKEFLQTIYG